MTIESAEGPGDGGRLVGWVGSVTFLGFLTWFCSSGDWFDFWPWAALFYFFGFFEATPSEA